MEFTDEQKEDISNILSSNDIEWEVCYNSDCSGSSTHFEYDEVMKAMVIYAEFIKNKSND